MAKSQSVGSSLSEWMCKKHGFVLAEKGAKNPKCKICGTTLSLNTWTMSG